MKVRILDYESLPQEIKETSLSECGNGKEYASYIIIWDNSDKIIRVESDAMEPEDCRFYRDLEWIKDAIEEAYEMGKKGV